MSAHYTTRSKSRAWGTEFPVGDPFSGPAYGKREDIGSAIGSIGGALVGGLFGSDAASTQADAATQAAGTSAAASKYAADIQKQIYDQTRADAQPWRTAGANALTQMVGGMGSTGTNGDPTRPFAMSDDQEDPGYQFRLQQGQQALQRAASAGGRLYSGRAMKDLSAYSGGQASQEYQNAYNRYNTNQTNQFNRLASTAGIGQTTNNTLAYVGTNYANAAGSNAVNAGNNQANAQLMAGQASASGYQGWGNALSSLAGNRNVQGLFGGSSWSPMETLYNVNGTSSTQSY